MVVLVVAGSIALGAASAALWIRGTLVDTDEFVDTLGPASENEEVASALSAFIVAQLSESLMLQDEIEGALPESASFLAAPLTEVIDNFAAEGTAQVIASDQFNQLWTAALTQAQRVALGIIRGDREVLDTSNGEVTVDLSPVVDQVVEFLDERGVDVEDVPDDAGRFVLVQNDQLAEIQQTVELLEALAWLPPSVALLLYVAALSLSRDRRRTLVGIGTGIAVAMAGVLVVLALARSGLVDVVEPRDSGAAGAIWDIVMRGFYNQTRVLLAFGVVLAGGAALAGPARWAVAMRSTVVGQVRSLRRRAELPGDRAGPLADLVGPRKAALRVTAVVVAFGVLLWLDRVTLGSLLAAVGALVIWFLLVEFFGYRAHNGGGGSDVQRADLVDLNSAGVDELRRLPGLGHELAEAVVEFRESHGRFGSVDDLAEVSGIGPSRVARMRDRVHVTAAPAGTARR